MMTRPIADVARLCEPAEATVAPEARPKRSRVVRGGGDGGFSLVAARAALINLLLRVLQRRAPPATVLALVPAHDEESGIAEAIESLRGQGQEIVVTVVADNCSDGTVGVARRLGCDVIESVGNTDQKAGALNQALAQVLPGCGTGSFVLVMDADTVLGPDFVASALAALADATVGAVGGIFRGRRPDNLLEALQCNEYDRCARQVGRRGGKAFVLTGTATLFRVEVLQALVAGRGYVYETASRTEDNEVTLAVRRLGWRAVSPKTCVVHTDLMADVGSLWRQRYRWYRGAVEDLRRYGWMKITAPYILRQAMLAVSVIMCALYILVIAAYHSLRFVWPWSLIWATVTAVFMLERVVTVRRGGWRAMALAAMLLPEFIYSTILQAVYVTAVTGAFLRPDAEKSW